VVWVSSSSTRGGTPPDVAMRLLSRCCWSLTVFERGHDRRDLRQHRCYRCGLGDVVWREHRLRLLGFDRDARRRLRGPVRLSRWQTRSGRFDSCAEVSAWCRAFGPFASMRLLLSAVRRPDSRGVWNRSLRLAAPAPNCPSLTRCSHGGGCGGLRCLKFAILRRSSREYIGSNES